mgnify:CR=1 FL=1
MSFAITNLLLLTLSTVLRWAYLVFEEQILKKIKNFRRIWILQSGVAVSVVANAYIFIFLVNRWVTAGYFPLSNLYESVLFLTWCLNTVQLISELKTSSIIIGSILTPIQLALIGFSSFVLPQEMQKPASLVPALQSNWLMLHVSMMMLSYAILILGSLLSVLIVLLSKKTKLVLTNESTTSLNSTDSVSSKKSSSKEKLLFNLDIWSYRTIGLGHIALTLGILAGAVWANESWGSYWSWDPKETWSLITWLVFTAYLHARLVNNWKGAKTAIIGSVGFVSIWISYLGVNFLANGLHSYGWVN